MVLFISFSLPELSRTILGVLVICALTFLCRVGGLIVIAMFILYLIFVLNLFCPLFRMLLLNVTHTNITHFSHSVCGFRHSWHQKYYLFLIWRNHLHSVSSKYYHLRKYVLSGLTSIIHCPQHLLQADGLERMNTVLLQHRPIWS